MTSADLKREQTERLAAAISRQGKYLTRLAWRMQRLGFPVDDPIYARALRARDATMGLLEGINEVQERNAMPAWVRSRDE